MESLLVLHLCGRLIFVLLQSSPVVCRSVNTLTQTGPDALTPNAGQHSRQLRSNSTCHQHERPQLNQNRYYLAMHVTQSVRQCNPTTPIQPINSISNLLRRGGFSLFLHPQSVQDWRCHPSIKVASSGFNVSMQRSPEPGNAVSLSSGAATISCTCIALKGLSLRISLLQDKSELISNGCTYRYTPH